MARKMSNRKTRKTYLSVEELERVALVSHASFRENFTQLVHKKPPVVTSHKQKHLPGKPLIPIEPHVSGGSHVTLKGTPAPQGGPYLFSLKAQGYAENLGLGINTGTSESKKATFVVTGLPKGVSVPVTFTFSIDATVSTKTRTDRNPAASVSIALASVDLTLYGSTTITRSGLFERSRGGSVTKGGELPVGTVQYTVMASNNDSFTINGLAQSSTVASTDQAMASAKLTVNLTGVSFNAVAQPKMRVNQLYDLKALAQSILDNPNVSYNDFHLSKVVDKAFPRQNIIDTAAGKLAQRSHYEKAPGGEVQLDPHMLAAMAKLAEKYSFKLSEIAGGSHDSAIHYSGVAFDIDALNGERVTKDNVFIDDFKKDAFALGASKYYGPGDYKHDTHIHVEWPPPGRI